MKVVDNFVSIPMTLSISIITQKPKIIFNSNQSHWKANKIIYNFHVYTKGQFKTETVKKTQEHETGYTQVGQLHKHIKREGSCPGTPCRSKRWNTLLFKAVISGEDLCPEMNALTILLAVRAPALNMAILSSRWWLKGLGL
ncbi:hypothetical protein MTR_0077s0040 [Medicago truncatula]|uniref:Uncharacterized protein n=1 Tax=Medicago truncatula TaxID=3880 RepID=A0A072TTM9_MEDTR|nr:hypothetical protein MTR_0077s0040 [Medicago truncatula]